MFDVVLCNPPFYEAENKRSPPTRPEKLLAHFESSATIVDFARAAKNALRENDANASAFFIYDARYTDRLLKSMPLAGTYTSTS